MRICKIKFFKYIYQKIKYILFFKQTPNKKYIFLFVKGVQEFQEKSDLTYY